MKCPDIEDPGQHPLFPLVRPTDPLPEPSFDGKTYDEGLDGARLRTALERVYGTLFARRGEWLTLRELAEAAGCSEAGASARIRDLRKAKFGGHVIEARRRTGGLWEYRLP